jgi:TatA/E family protein of Tat protein translocase
MLYILLFLESLGGGELLIILLFILIFFGSNKIPDLARGLGKGMREMKDAMQGVQSELRQTMNDVKKDADITEEPEKNIEKKDEL